MPTLVQIPCPACGAANRVPRERFLDVPVCGKCRARLFATHPVALDETSFERYVAHSGLPVLVDFWAEWCGPCRVMAPHFEQVARAHAGRVLFAKLDTEAAPEVARRFGIEAIPTLILFQEGRAVARHEGALGAAELTRWLAGQPGAPAG